MGGRGIEFINIGRAFRSNYLRSSIPTNDRNGARFIRRSVRWRDLRYPHRGITFRYERWRLVAKMARPTVTGLQRWRGARLPGSRRHVAASWQCIGA